MAIFDLHAYNLIMYHGEATRVAGQATSGNFDSYIFISNRFTE